MFGSRRNMGTDRSRGYLSRHASNMARTLSCPLPTAPCNASSHSLASMIASKNNAVLASSLISPMLCQSNSTALILLAKSSFMSASFHQTSRVVTYSNSTPSSCPSPGIEPEVTGWPVATHLAPLPNSGRRSNDRRPQWRWAIVSISSERRRCSRLFAQARGATPATTQGCCIQRATRLKLGFPK